MRVMTLMSIVFLGLSCAAHAAEPPSANSASTNSASTNSAATDSVEYDKAVARIWGSINSTDHVVQWCAKNAGKSKKPVQTAYRDWKARFAPLIADIDARMDRMMNSSGAYSAAELATRKADVLKRGAERYNAGIATEPQDAVKHECELLPEYFTTRSFDLEARFASELVLIRARPLAKTPSTPAPPRN